MSNQAFRVRYFQAGTLLWPPVATASAKAPAFWMLRGYSEGAANVVPRCTSVKARLTSVVLCSRAMLQLIEKTVMVFRATESMRKRDHSFGSVRVQQQVEPAHKPSKACENGDARLRANCIETGMAMYYAQRRRRFLREGFWRHADGVICG